MALLVSTAKDSNELNNKLRGGITGGQNVYKRAVSEGLFLHGLTLVFNVPSATVTFAASPANVQTPILWPSIVSQIATQTSNAVKVVVIGGAIGFVLATPSAAVDLDLTGTANAIFGFSTAADTVGTLYAAPGGSAPALVSVAAINGTSSFVLVTNEA